MYFNFFKKTISIIIAVLIVILSLPVGASASVGLTGGINATETQAAELLRNALVERKNSLTINIRNSKTNDVNKIISNIEQKTYDQNEVIVNKNGYTMYKANLGDYLHWSVKEIKTETNVVRNNKGTYDIQIIFTPKMYTTSTQEDAFESYLSEYVGKNQINKKTTYEKVKFIHDWICKNTKVLNTNGNYDNTAYKAYFYNAANSKGYASLFYYLMIKSKVECRIITNGTHFWNIVKMEDGKWYNIDVAYDDNDKNNTISYSAFLKSDNTSDFKFSSSKNTEYKSSYFKKQYPIANVNYYGITNVKWVKKNGKTYCYKNGNILKYRQKINGKWYYFNGKGEMATGFVTFSNGKRYYKANGEMKTGWIKLSNRWYLFDYESGIMKKWWTYDIKKQKTYYFNSNGQMMTGWLKGKTGWYYLGGDGVRRTGWQTINGKKYYFYSTDGLMAENCYIRIGSSRVYHFAKDGHLVN